MESPNLLRVGNVDKDEHEVDHERGNGDHDSPIITSESEKLNVSSSSKDTEMKNLGSQARLSSEARYSRFSEYVLRKISGQVLKNAKKGLWKVEIFLADSLWSHDPENQRRLLTALPKQELSARIFPSHNKKIRILIWWSIEPPLHVATPFVSKKENRGNVHLHHLENESKNENELGDQDEKKKAQFEKLVIKKRDIALDEDSSSSSASVIETDFHQIRKVDKHIKQKTKKAQKAKKKKLKKNVKKLPERKKENIIQMLKKNINNMKKKK